jgi:hypothetical protein
MNDVRSQDRRIFLHAALEPGRLLAVAVLGFAGYVLLRSMTDWPSLLAAATVAILAIAAHLATSYRRSLARRFLNPRYKALWAGCEDRLARFRVAVRAMRRRQIAEFSEMPRTIESVGEGLYLALRRADIAFHEITTSEGWLLGGTVASPAPHHDPQARELYRLADKNIAEYRQQYNAVMAGVHRAEAQAAVFTTTLDTLRLKMLGYRLSGRAEFSTKDFLESLTEAKMQLESIDKALDELEMSPFPKTITVMPDDEPPLRAGN